MKYLSKKEGWTVFEAVEDSLLPGIFAIIDKEQGKDAHKLVDIEDIDEVFFDGGGMVNAKEPKVEITIDGVKFSTFLRQVEFITPSLRSIGERFKEYLGKYVLVQGKWNSYWFTLTTALKIAEEFDLARLGRDKEVDETWGDLRNAVSSLNKDELRCFHADKAKCKENLDKKVSR